MPSKHAIRDLRWSPDIVAASLASNVLGLALPLVMIQLYDRVIPNQGYETLFVLALGLGLAIVGDAALKLARGSLMAHAGKLYELRSNSAATRAVLDDAFRDNRAPGVIYNELAQIDRVRRFHSGDTGAALMDVPFIFIFLGLMIWISPILGSTVLLLIAGVFIVIRLLRRQIVALNKERLERDGRRQSFLIETLGGFETVKALGAEAFMERRYERLMAGSAPLGATLAARQQMTQGVTGAVAMLAPVVTAGVGAFMVIQGQLNVGALAAMVLLTGRILQPALRIESLLIGDEDVRELEKTLDPLVNRPHQPGLAADMPPVSSLSLAWSPLLLENVETTADMPFGQSISDLTLVPGDCIVLDGAEGAGRSTMMGAIAGYRDHPNINVSYDGQPAEAFSADQRSKRISILSRDNATLNGSLLDNLTRFQPDRYKLRALELAATLGLDSFLAQHPRGLDLHIGGNAGGELPTSVADLVHIIAALVTDPDVILFDQASGALDQEANAKLLALLGRLQPSKIIIIVASQNAYRQLASRHFDVKDARLYPSRPHLPLDLRRYGRLVG